MTTIKMNFETTFVNGDDKTVNKGYEALESVLETLQEFIEGMSSDDEDLSEEAYDNFANWGLSFEAVTEEDEETGEVNHLYFKYLLSWGGPSTEIRFYQDDSIEFVYMDWFVGVGYDVTDSDQFIYLKDWLDDAGMLEVLY